MGARRFTERGRNHLVPTIFPPSFSQLRRDRFNQIIYPFNGYNRLIIHQKDFYSPSKIIHTYYGAVQHNSQLNACSEKSYNIVLKMPIQNEHLFGKVTKRDTLPHLPVKKNVNFSFVDVINMVAGPKLSWVGREVYVYQIYLHSIVQYIGLPHWRDVRPGSIDKKKKQVIS